MEGYVYVMVNSALPGLVKIGKTTKNPEIRARELRQTGTPTPFVVAYSVRVLDCDLLEAELHADLAASRESNQREFFRVSCSTAVDLLIGKSRDMVLDDLKNIDAVGSGRASTKNALYVGRVNSDRGMIMRKEILDNDAIFPALAGSIIGLDYDDDDPDESFLDALQKHPDNEPLYCYCEDDHYIYRVGFTSLPEEAVNAELVNYWNALQGEKKPAPLRPSSLMLYVPGVREFPLDSIQEEYRRYFLSFREQLLYMNWDVLKAFVDRVKSIAQDVASAVEEEKEEVNRLQRLRDLSRKL